MTAPVAYTPAVETPSEDEQKIQQELIDTLLSISKTTLKDERDALRAVHAKSHGLIKAKFIVADGLAPDYAQGLFARPGTYDAVLRLSSAPGDLLPDSVSTHHGLGLKITDAASGQVQDFLLANGKAFVAPDPKGFLKNLKLLAPTTDKAEGLKVALSTALRAVEGTLEAVGLESGTLTSLGGHPAYPVLSEEFYSQTAFRYGAYIAKFGIVPATEAQKALKDQLIDLGAHFDAQRQAVRAFLAANPAAWEFRVQLCTDLEKMPVENPTVAWPEKESPYVTVARIEAPAQESYSDELVAKIDREASFSPWHCLEEHRPLGAINRVRKAVYDASARFRLEKNGCPFHSAA